MPNPEKSSTNIFQKIINEPIKLIIPVAILAALLALGGYIIKFHETGLSPQTANWGTFGDYIGGVLGTIFSFTSVLLIYFTFKRQQETSVLQQFETTFFALLSVQREMMKSVTGPVKPKDGLPYTYRGDEFFEEFEDGLMVDMIFEEFETSDNQKDWLNKIYNNRYDLASRSLSPYYRHLYHFLNYTDTSEIVNKKKYFDLVQSQMGAAELFSLFYYTICVGPDSLMPILNKYNYFENIESESLVFEAHKKIYLPTK